MSSFLDAVLDRVLALLNVDLNSQVSLQGERFNKITEAIYLGARPSAEHIGALKCVGITHVVSVLPAEECSKMTFLKADFETLFISAHDRVNFDFNKGFSGFVQFAEDVLSSDVSSKLLIHCEAGVSRSASLAIALVMKQEQKTFFEAFEKVRAKRPRILPNIGFASQLQNFEAEIRNSNANSRDMSSLAQYLHQFCDVPVEVYELDSRLKKHNYHAMNALHEIFGEELPRVIQGIRF